MERVFLVGEPEFVDDSAVALRGCARVVGTSGRLREALSMISDLGPGIIVVDQDMAEGGLEAASRIARENPDLMVFLACVRAGFEAQRNAKSRGLRNVLSKPLDREEFDEIVQAAREEEARCRRPARSIQDEPMARRRTPDAWDDGGRGPIVARQEIVVFYSPKGGVGKTTMAVNLSTCFAQSGLRTALVDLDVRANIGLVLDMHAGARINDWVPMLNETLDRKAVESAMSHHPAGMWVLLGLRKVFDSDDLSAELVAKAVEALRRCFDVIVVDVGPELRDSAVVAFDAATRLFIVSTVEKPALRAVVDAAEALEAMGIDDAKTRLILNRVPAKPDLPLRRVADLLPFPLVARVPEDPQVREFANRGEIPVIAKPDGPFSAEMRRLAESVIPALRVSGNRRRGLFSGLFAVFGRKPRPGRLLREERY